MVYIKEGITENDLTYIYNHNSIKKLATDHREAKPIYNEFAVYYSAYNDNKFLGAYLVIKQSELEYEIHILLLPESIKYTRKLSNLILKEIFKKAHRVTAKIYSNLKTIQNMTARLGFKYEGTMRETYLINGEYIDTIIYGMLKSEFKEI